MQPESVSQNKAQNGSRMMSRYMAAVKAAAAEAHKDRPPSRDAHAHLPLAQPKSERCQVLLQLPRLVVSPLMRIHKVSHLRRERLLEKLLAVYESGSVVPIPFLKAANAAPMALLNDVRDPYNPPGAYVPPLVCLFTTHLLHDQSPARNSMCMVLRTFAHLVPRFNSHGRGRGRSGRWQSTTGWRRWPSWQLRAAAPCAPVHLLLRSQLTRSAASAGS